MDRPVIYLLLSLKDYKTYLGSTVNLKSRIKQHFSGKVTATKNRLPLKLIYFEEFESILDARKKEKYYKTAAGRKKLRQILETRDRPPRRDETGGESRRV